MKNRVVGSLLILFASAGSLLAQDSWNMTKAPMPLGRWMHASAATGGYLYAFAGESDNGYVHENYRYDPVSDSWTARGYISNYDGLSPVTWTNPGGAAVGGKIYQFGGTVQLGWASLGDNTCWEYDPASDQWTRITAGLPGLFGSCQAVEAGGRIYIASRYGSTVTLVEFDPSTKTFTTKEPHARAVSSFYLGGLGGKVYLAGGRIGTTNQRETYEYDPATNLWTLKSGLMPAANYAGASACAKGKFFTLGGSVGTQDQVYGYDPAADSWATYASAPAPLLMGSAATLTANGSTRIHFTGGLDMTYYWVATTNLQYAPPSLGKPADPTGLFMRRMDGTPIPHGAFTGPTLVVGAQLDDPTGANVQLQVEVAMAGASFTGNPTHEGPMQAPGEASVQVSGNAGPYKWRARCWSSNEELNAAGWIEFGPSDPDFTVDNTPPTAPSPTGPIDTTVRTPVLIPSAVGFTWTEATDDSPDPMTYEIQVTHDPTFSTIARVGTGAGSSGSVQLSWSNAPYYWRVRAVDAFGNAGPWSGVVSFMLAYDDGIDHGSGDARCSSSTASNSFGLTLALVLLTGFRMLRRRAA